MKPWTTQRALVNIAVAAGIWAAVAAACLCVGSTGNIGWPDMDAGKGVFNTVFRIRLESVLLASLVGAALAASGVVYQAILKNPLADPYLLGVSTGSALLGYLWQFGWMTAVVSRIGGDGGMAISQNLFSFIGALAAIGIVFALASARGRLEPVTLVLVGVIVNAINAAIFLLVVAISRQRPGMAGPMQFLVGGINAAMVSRQQMIAAVLLIGAGWIWLLSMAGRLNVAALGDAEAQSLGVRIHLLRWQALLCASLVAAAAIAISGPIAFVGLVCPHLARMIVGPDNRRLLPWATALGAALLTVADAAGRYLSGSAMGELLPVGVLTSLLGGPFFLVLLFRQRRQLSAAEGI